MFVVYALPIGLLLGFLLGGRPAGLAAIKFRWAWLAIAGFVTQIILFSAPVSDRIGDAGPLVYVSSTAMVLAAVVANIRIPGMVLVAVGATSNLAAIVANGGFMPASAAAVAAIGRGEIVTYSNSAVIPNPALEPLTDVIALPTWLPFTNIISIGDLLIGAGIAAVIAVAMRSVRPNLADPDDGSQTPVLDGNSPI
jgi:uncharacterized protein DUF5317